eukprot:gene10332-12685_t
MVKIPKPQLRKSKSDLLEAYRANRDIINFKLNEINNGSPINKNILPPPPLPPRTHSIQTNPVNNNNNNNNFENTYYNSVTPNAPGQLIYLPSHTQPQPQPQQSIPHYYQQSYIQQQQQQLLGYPQFPQYPSQQPYYPQQQPSGYNYDGYPQFQQQPPPQPLPNQQPDQLLQVPSTSQTNGSMVSGKLEYQPTTRNRSASKLNDLDLDLLEEMVEKIPAINMTKEQKKRSSSFSFSNRDSLASFLPSFTSSNSNYRDSASTTSSSRSAINSVDSAISTSSFSSGNGLQYAPASSTTATTTTTTSTSSMMAPIITVQQPLQSSHPTGLSRADSFTPCFTSFKRQSLRDPILFAGELYKKNRNVGWKRCYFILTSQKLLYSTTQIDTPKRELILKDYIPSVLSESGLKYYCFALNPNTSMGTSYIFGADDEETRTKWLNNISIASSVIAHTTLNPTGLEQIPIPSIKKQSLSDVEYHKKLPSDLRVNIVTDDIIIFRLRIFKLLKLASQWSYKSDQLYHAELLNNIPIPKLSLQAQQQQRKQSVSTTTSTPITNNQNNVSVTIDNPNRYQKQLQSKLIKVSIFHNGLIIKVKVDVNDTIGSILNQRPDLFSNNPNLFGLAILGSMEHIFDQNIKLKDLQYVQKCIRFKKGVKFTTVDFNLHSKIFYPNVMQNKEWQSFLTTMNQFGEDLESISGYVIRGKKNLPPGVENTKLILTISSLSGTQTQKNNLTNLLKPYYSVKEIPKVPLFIEISVMYGDQCLAKGRTSSQPMGDWNEKLYFDIKIVDFPKECVFLTCLYSKTSSGEQILLAQYPHIFLSVNNKKLLYSEFEIPLIPITSIIQNRPVYVNLNDPPGSSNNNSSTNSLMLNGHQSFSISANSGDILQLKVEVPGIPNSIPIYFEDPEPSGSFLNPLQPNQLEIQMFSNLLKKPRFLTTTKERSILWKHRFYCKANHPNILPTLLYNFPLTDYHKRVEVYEVIRDWPEIDPSYGLELLSSDFIDDKIREKGVESINTWNDDDLSLYLPQVIQAVKNESSHYSALVCFILKRSFSNPVKIGQSAFWQCSNEINIENYGKQQPYHIFIRYKLIMEALLIGLGLQQSAGSPFAFGQSLLHQHLMIQILKQINLDIIKEPDKQKKILETRLATLPPKFTLPTNPLQECNTFIIEECKVKDSNAAPIWLVFSSTNPAADVIKVIFKKDDVKPDELCLQLFSTMDKILKSNGLDCNFTIFKCMSVGSGLGLIEVVPNSITLADFVRDQSTIETWLKRKNPMGDEYITIFLRSCAAYSVATYILGIYDRHNDNLMVSETGHFFHIDFGYFLGKVTKFLIFERETAPFVLTKNIVQMLGSREKEYRDLCCEIYNVLRNNSRELLNLISMSKDLSTQSGLDTVRERLKLDFSNDEAISHFQSLIEKSKSNIRAELNNVIHVMVHPN